MEHRLGTALLYRKTKGVEPTEAGATLARHARNLVRLMERTDAEMSEFADGARGHVRVVANTSAITQFLPEDLSAFKSQNPDVQIVLREETSARAILDVSEGLADIAIFSEVVDANELETFPYFRDQLVVIIPKSHPLTSHKSVDFTETLDYPHVGLQPGSSLLGQLLAKAEETEQAISFSVQVTSFDGVRRMVESGLGIAILPGGALPAQTSEQNFQILPLNDAWAHRQLLVGVREADALPVIARKLLKNLVRL